MLEDLRVVLRRATNPSTLLLALLVAVLETATGFAAGLVSPAIEPHLSRISVLHY